MDNSRMVSLRLSTHLLEQIDQLVAELAGDPSVSPSGLATRADVMRHLLLQGVQHYEQKPRKKK